MIFIFLIALFIFFPFALNLSPYLYPETGDKNITVKFEYKGAYEKDIEKLINLLEQPLSALPDLESVYSVSASEKGIVCCSFSEKKDYDQAYIEVRDCVKRVYAFFPENVQRPVFIKSGLNNYPVFAASFEVGQFRESRKIAEAFEKIEGCSTAEAAGESCSEIIIVPDTDKINQSGFSVEEIAAVLRNENYSEVITSPGLVQIKAGEKISGIDEIKNILFSPGSKIDNYASVLSRKKETDSEGRINGKKKIIIYAEKEGRSSVVEVCREFKKTAEKLGGEVLFSKGEEIEKALVETAYSVAAGIIAVVVVSVVYFRNPFFSLLVILNIAFSILVSAASLKINGHNLDIITMSGFALVSGLAIDNSIIFLEKYKKIKGDIDEAISDIIYPLLFSFLTTSVVFLPLFFASAKLKTMLSGIAVSVFSGLAASFLFTFYFVPCLLNQNTEKSADQDLSQTSYGREHLQKNGKYRLNKYNNSKSNNLKQNCFKQNKQENIIRLSENGDLGMGRQNKTFCNFSVIRPIQDFLLKVLEILTFYRALPLLLLGIMIISVFMLFSGLEYRPFNFISKNSMAFIMEFPSGSSPHYVREKALSVEKELLRFIENHERKIINMAPMEKSGGIKLLLKIEKERACFDLKMTDEKYTEEIQRCIDDISRLHRDIFFHYPVQVSACNYDIVIYSRDHELASADAYRLGGEIEAASSSLRTVYHFKTPPEGLKVVFNRGKTHNYLISPFAASKYIYTLLTVPVISKIYSDGNEQDIRIGSVNTYTPDKLKKIILSSESPEGKKNCVELNEVSRLVSYFSPPRIYHRNRQRSVSMSVTGIKSDKDAERIESIISGFAFSKGCRGEGGNLYHEKMDDTGKLFLLLFLSVFFIITVLVVQFESVKVPLLITAGIPSSFLVPLAVMKLSGTDLTVSTALALLLSSGICVNNAILVLSPFKGQPVITKKQAAISLSEKTAAVLASSFTTILSILPLIFTGTDSLLAPFSIVLSSGIAGSVIVLPVIVSACCRG